jgi:hypothetical protein
LVASSSYRRRATAIPNGNATNSEPRGASRAMLLKMLNGMPGFRPLSIALPIRWTVPFTASGLPQPWTSAPERDLNPRKRTGVAGCHRSWLNLLVNIAANRSDGESFRARACRSPASRTAPEASGVLSPCFPDLASDTAVVALRLRSHDGQLSNEK